MIDTEWTDTPYPAWEGIESLMASDDEFTVPEGPFVSVFINGEMAGSFSVIPWSSVCLQIHGGINKRFWGKGVEICTALGMFLFTSSPIVKIVAIVPEFNRLMRRCLVKTGLTQEGIVAKSFMKNMKLHDQYVYGVYRGEVIRCQQQQSVG